MAFVRRIITNRTLEDNYSEDRIGQLATFSKEDQKKIRESRVFVSFATTSGLVRDPFDHANPDPPLPDIHIAIDGQRYYFELAEITDQGVAWSVSLTEKTDEITGGPFSQLDPLLRMFREKCAKTYQTEGSPVDLLLHYSRQHPAERILLEHLKTHQPEIMRLINDGPFSRVWVYLDWPPGKVLWQGSR